MQSNSRFSAIAFSILFFCLTGNGFAQDCANIDFAAFNMTGGEGSQLNVAFEISEFMGPTVVSGFWEVTASGVYEPMCLPVGCYSIAIEGTGVNPSALEVQLMQSDYIIILSDWAQNGAEGPWVNEFCVEEPIEFACPEAIDYAAGEACSWAFLIGYFQPGEEITWNFGDGDDEVVGDHFIEHDFPNAGTYEVTAFFTSWNCPMGVYLSTIVEVEGCGEEECTLEMGVASADAIWYTFSIPEQPEGAIIEWYIDGQVVPPTSDNGLTFEAGFDFNPNWSVCVEVFTAACPQGMEACYTNLESSDCPDPDVMEVEYLGGCYALFWLYDENVTEIGWSVNGELIEWTTGIFFDYTFPSDGVYSVTAELYSATCQGELYEWEIEIEDCADVECYIEAVASEIECNEFLIEAIDFPEGSELFWTMDGEPWDVNTSEFIFTSADEECHDFSVGYESENCPDGVADVVEVCLDCEGDDCDISIVWETLANGVYLFSAIHPDGQLLAQPVDWFTMGENIGTGNPFAWTWNNEEAYSETLCVDVASLENCAAAEVCVELEVNPMECEEVQFVLDVEWEWQQESEWAFQLFIQAHLDDFAIEGWSLNLEWNEFGDLLDTVSACLPMACFDMSYTAELPLGSGVLETFVLSVIREDGQSTILVDVQNGVSNEFGLHAECDTSSELEELQTVASLPSLWPNPARGSVNWALPKPDFIGELVVYTSGGNRMHNESVSRAVGELDVSQWPAGVYTVFWFENETSVFSTRLFVANE